MDKKIKLELKVGLFVITGLVILVIFIFKVGSPLLEFKGAYYIRILFSDAAGIKLNSPVRFLGIDAGEVKKIDFSFSPDGEIQGCIIGVLLRKDIKLPSDSTAHINSLGLLGEKYIEINPGKDYKNLLKDGDFLLGITPPSIYKLTNRIDTLISSIQEILDRIKTKEGTLGRLLYDDSLYRELEDLVKDLRKNPWKLMHKPREKKR